MSKLDSSGKDIPVKIYANTEKFAKGMADASKKLRDCRLHGGWQRKMVALDLPTWKWWEFRKHLKTDWRRYRKLCAFRKKRDHYDWVNEP